VVTVTALRDDRRGRVAVELDGAPWRVLPVDVVVRAGLSEGRQLDRPSLRELRRELRRAEALGIATRALKRRDVSVRGLSARLERARVAPAAAADSLEVLGRAGLVDDARFARRRAALLGERGYGDEAIRHDLEAQGVGADAIAGALEELEPELDRARRVVARRGCGPRTARYLAAKGHAQETVEAALGAGFGHDT
jgi:SOS response regulatory protein OraA/RecX